MRVAFLLEILLKYHIIVTQTTNSLVCWAWKTLSKILKFKLIIVSYQTFKSRFKLLLTSDVDYRCFKIDIDEPNFTSTRNRLWTSSQRDIMQKVWICTMPECARTAWILLLDPRSNIFDEISFSTPYHPPNHELNYKKRIKKSNRLSFHINNTKTTPSLRLIPITVLHKKDLKI